MDTRRSVIFMLMIANLAVAFRMNWSVWNRISVAASATVVLLDAGRQIAEWAKSGK